jgi:hypothetical protein
MASKANEASNIAFVPLTEEELGIYDKRQADYARQNVIILVWERISHETKASGSRISSYKTI